MVIRDWKLGIGGRGVGGRETREAGEAGETRERILDFRFCGKSERRFPP
ncbi:MAG: hypothetical protein ACRAVC_05830 [Trichormus sp.]